MIFFSIKYKLSLILTLIIFFSLGGMFVLATRQVENEKISYEYRKMLDTARFMETRIKYFENSQKSFISLLSKVGNFKERDRALKENISFKGVYDFNSSYRFGIMKQKPIKSARLFNIRDKILYEEVENSSMHFAYALNISEILDIKEIGEERGLFMSRDGEVYNTDTNVLEMGTYLSNNFFKKGISNGVSELKIGDVKYMISFVRLSSNLNYVIYTEQKSALQSLFFLKKKFDYYFLSLLLLTVGIVIIVSNKITSNVTKLRSAMEGFGMGDMKRRARVMSTDELGVMSNVFDIMAENTENLVSEVKSYTAQLEDIVKKRTFSLAKATRLQKAMMNSVGQGFLMINKNLKVMNIYSKEAENHFFQKLEGQPIVDVLGVPVKDRDILAKLFSNFFEERIPFKSLVSLAPKVVSNKKCRILHLDYEAIRSKDNQILGFVIVSTDKTDEVRLGKEAEEERARAKMILKIANCKLQFVRLLQLTKEYIEIVRERGSTIEYDEGFRLIHNLKGGFSSFFMEAIVEHLHGYETDLKERGGAGDYKTCVYSCMVELEEKIDDFMIEYKGFLKEDSWRDVDIKVSFDISHLNRIANKIRKMSDVTTISAMVEDEFLKVPVRYLLSSFPEEASYHASVVGKSLKEIRIVGGDTKVFPAFFSEFTSVLTHLLRNSIDHGIEGPSIRQVLGKEENGEIRIEITEDSDNLFINFHDDGGGININKLEILANEKGVNTSEMSKNEILMLIFTAGISTSEEVSLTSGRGVGMDIVKIYVEDNGGEITVESIENVGTVFKILFPVDKMRPQIV